MRKHLWRLLHPRPHKAGPNFGRYYHSATLHDNIYQNSTKDDNPLRNFQKMSWQADHFKEQVVWVENSPVRKVWINGGGWFANAGIRWEKRSNIVGVSGRCKKKGNWNLIIWQDNHATHLHVSCWMNLHVSVVSPYYWTAWHDILQLVLGLIFSKSFKLSVWVR